MVAAKRSTRKREFPRVRRELVSKSYQPGRGVHDPIAMFPRRRRGLDELLENIILALTRRAGADRERKAEAAGTIIESRSTSAWACGHDAISEHLRWGPRSLPVCLGKGARTPRLRGGARQGGGGRRWRFLASTSNGRRCCTEVVENDRQGAFRGLRGQRDASGADVAEALEERSRSRILHADGGGVPQGADRDREGRRPGSVEATSPGGARKDHLLKRRHRDPTGIGTQSPKGHHAASASNAIVTWFQRAPQRGGRALAGRGSRLFAPTASPTSYR